jgi:hypothetical protein
MGGREVIVIRDENVFLQWSGRVLDKVQHGICISYHPKHIISQHNNRLRRYGKCYYTLILSSAHTDIFNNYMILPRIRQILDPLLTVLTHLQTSYSDTISKM